MMYALEVDYFSHQFLILSPFKSAKVNTSQKAVRALLISDLSIKIMIMLIFIVAYDSSILFIRRGDSIDLVSAKWPTVLHFILFK